LARAIRRCVPIHISRFKDQFSFWSQLRPVSHIRDHVHTKMAAVEHTSPSFGIHHRNTVIEYGNFDIIFDHLRRFQARYGMYTTPQPMWMWM